MTAEKYLEVQYVTTDITGDIKLTTVIAAKHYGDLRAKEAVKEFAKKYIKRHDEGGMSNYNFNLFMALLKQKGVEI